MNDQIRKSNCGTGAGQARPGCSKADTRPPLTPEEIIEETRDLAEMLGMTDETPLFGRDVPFAARFLGCGQSTVRRLIARGHLTSTRESPRTTRIDFRDLVEFSRTGIDRDGVRIEVPRSVEWAAEKLGCSRRTVLRRIEDGTLRCVHYSRRLIMVEEADVLALAARNADETPHSGATEGAVVTDGTVSRQTTSGKTDRP